MNVLEAHHTLQKPLPVNMRFCFEGMEENGSEGLDDMILAEVKKGRDSWFDGVDAVCIVRFPSASEFLKSHRGFSQTIIGSTPVHLA